MNLANDQIATKGDVVWFEVCQTKGRSVELSSGAGDGARLLVYAAEPIDEPVVFGGPFVMNTQEEIDQAFADLRDARLTENSQVA